MPRPLIVAILLGLLICFASGPIVNSQAMFRRTTAKPKNCTAYSLDQPALLSWKLLEATVFAVGAEHVFEIAGHDERTVRRFC
jgi:hypothetical protein